MLTNGYFQQSVVVWPTLPNIAKSRNEFITYLSWRSQYKGRRAINTAEPDIPKSSLVEVELAIEKFERHKANGVEHIPSELIQAGGGKLYEEYINSLHSFGTRNNCYKNGKNPLLFQFIRKAIE